MQSVFVLLVLRRAMPMTMTMSSIAINTQHALERSEPLEDICRQTRLLRRHFGRQAFGSLGAHACLHKRIDLLEPVTSTHCNDPLTMTFLQQGPATALVLQPPCYGKLTLHRNRRHFEGSLRFVKQLFHGVLNGMAVGRLRVRSVPICRRCLSHGGGQYSAYQEGGKKNGLFHRIFCIHWIGNGYQRLAVGCEGHGSAWRRF